MQALYQLLSKYVTVSDKDGNAGGFSLFVSPPIRDLDATCSFWDQGLSPAALVRFKYTALGASSYTCSLPLETMPVPAPVSVAEKSEPAPAGTKTSTMESVSVGRAMNDVPSSNNVNEKPATGRKLPKWLKLGK